MIGRVIALSINFARRSTCVPKRRLASSSDMPRACANVARRVNATAAGPPTLRSTIDAIFSAVRMKVQRSEK
jgi:hypothetical protein